MQYFSRRVRSSTPAGEIAPAGWRKECAPPMAGTPLAGRSAESQSVDELSEPAPRVCEPVVDGNGCARPADVQLGTAGQSGDPEDAMAPGCDQPAHSIDQLASEGDPAGGGCDTLARLQARRAPGEPVGEAFPSLPEAGGLSSLDEVAVDRLQLQPPFANPAVDEILHQR